MVRFYAFCVYVEQFLSVFLFSIFFTIVLMSYHLILSNISDLLTLSLSFLFLLRFFCKFMYNIVVSILDDSV